jgi:hypothetical protein
MNRINRSPDGGEGNGGSAEDPLPAGNAGDSTNLEAKAPEYVGKADFEAFRNEFRQSIQRLTPREQAREDAKSDSKAPERPNPKDFDFVKDPTALQRYEDAISEFNFSKWQAKQKTEGEATQAVEREKSDARGHQSRVSDYAKENPSFAADMKAAAGKINVTDPVAKSIYGSKNGHLAVHYMAKNPGADRELNLLADTDGPAAVRERIGEMAAEMRGLAKQTEEVTHAAGVRPPRQTFRGGASSTPRTLSDAERFTRFSKG